MQVMQYIFSVIKKKEVYKDDMTAAEKELFKHITRQTEGLVKTVLNLSSGYNTHQVSGLILWYFAHFER